MYNDRASTKQIVLTLAFWTLGLLALAGIIVAISTAMAPETPELAPVNVGDATGSATPTPTISSAVPTFTPTPVPTPVLTPTPTPTPMPSIKPTPTSSKPLTGKVVAIDAGHQASGDSSLEPIGPGAAEKKAKVAAGSTGVETRNPESLINLKVALKLQKELVRLGAKVVMIRTTQSVNISNSKRASIANNAKADLFIRLHCDGNSNRSLTGLSTLIPGSNTWTKPIVAKSKKAGTYIHRAVIAETGANDRGVVSRSDLSGFNWSKVPTVLVEMGFLSNPGEDVKLGSASYQQDLAVGMATGIENYLTAD